MIFTKSTQLLLKSYGILFFYIAAIAFPELTAAAPTGGRVAQGMVTITYDPPVIRLVQQSDSAVIFWDSFNMSPGETVEIIQPSKRARLVNRMNHAGATLLGGTIESNGQVLILNPNGVSHQSTAYARVGGLVLSGWDLRSFDVASDTIRLLNEYSARPGAVKNHGMIETIAGGNVVLAGKSVLNEGVIKGDFGSIALGVGRGGNILFEGSGLINFNITDEVVNAPETRGELLENDGEINAPGGRIFLAGSRSSRAFKLQGQGTENLAGESQIALAPGAQFAFGGGTKVINRGTLQVSGSDLDGDTCLCSGRVVVIADNLENEGWIYATALRNWINPAPVEKLVAGQIVLAAAELVRGGGFSSLMVDAIGGDPSIRILGKAIQLQGSLGAGGGGSIFVGGKGTSPSAQLVDTVTAIVSADVWGDDSFTTAKYKVWASEELEASGLLYLQTGSGSEVEFVSGNRLKFTARVVASADAASPGTLLLQAKDVLVAFENEPWSLDVMKVNSALTYAKVTVKADRNLTVAGYPSALFLMGFVYWVRPASLSLIAGNDLQLQNAIVGKIGDFSLQAGNDIHISNFSATTNLGGGCRISAGRNVYISDSIFSNWCYATIPSQIQTGGQLFLNNVVFYQ